MERRHVLPPFGTRVPKSLSAGATLAFAALLVNVALVEFFYWSGLAEMSRAGGDWLPSPGFPNIPLILFAMAVLWLFKVKRIERRPISAPNWNLGKASAAIAWALPLFLIGMFASFRVVGFLVEMLPTACQATLQEREKTLLGASASGNVPTLLGLLALGTDPIILRQAIHEAARNVHPTALRLLLATSHDPEDSLYVLQYPDIQSRGGCLAMLAAHARRTSGSGDESRLQVRFGQVIAEAARGRNFDVLEYLLAAGADPNQVNSVGNTALLELTKNDQSDSRLEDIHKLVEAGASVDCLNRDKLTPLMVAIRYRQYETIQYLLRHGSRVSWMSHNAFTQAAETNDPKVVRILFEFAPKEQITGDLLDNDEALSALVQSPARMEMVRAVWDNLDAPLRVKFSQSLILQRNVDCVRFAVEEGYDPNLVNKWGDTVLIAHVQSGNEDIVAFLLDHGANVNQQDSEGHTALDYATTDAMKRLLRAHGGRSRKPVSHECGC